MQAFLGSLQRPAVQAALTEFFALEAQGVARIPDPLGQGQRTIMANHHRSLQAAPCRVPCTPSSR